MDSRQRFHTAAARREPDRVPISFGGTLASGILECPPKGCNYSHLCAHLGFESVEAANIGYMGNFVSNIDERIMDRFGSDFRRIDPNDQPIELHPDGMRTLLGTRCGIRTKKIGYYDDIFDFPLKNAQSRKDIQNYPFWPSPEDFRNLSIGKREEAKHLRTDTGYALVVDTLLSFPFLMYSLLTGYEKYFLDMKLNPNFYFALSDRLLDVGFGIVESFLGAVGDHIDMICTYDDLGTQEGLFCSRNDYMTFIHPYEKQMVEFIKKHTDAKIYRHCCGAVFELIPDFIELGVEILNPLQPRAKNMEPWRLKKEFGKDLAFFGGIDTQKLLPNGAPRDVEANVKETMRIYGQGGGYILATSTNIEPDTPVENIVALFEAGLKWGTYPLS